LEENPDLHPAGLNVDSAYAITVRRSKWVTSQCSTTNYLITSKKFNSMM
jgi:hypothetical protein